MEVGEAADLIDHDGRASVKAFQTRLSVDLQGRATLWLPPDVRPGEHEAVVIIQEEPRPRRPLEFASHDVGPWPFAATDTLRREDIYGDDGR